EDLEQTLDTLFISGKRIEAAFFATNTLSVNGLKYLNKRNFHIPDDLAVVCFDESDSFDFFYCPVTHVKQPLTDIAEKAVQLLISQIEDRNADPEQVVYPAELIVEKSCGKGQKAI